MKPLCGFKFPVSVVFLYLSLWSWFSVGNPFVHRPGAGAWSSSRGSNTRNTRGVSAWISPGSTPADAAGKASRAPRVGPEQSWTKKLRGWAAQRPEIFGLELSSRAQVGGIVDRRDRCGGSRSLSGFKGASHVLHLLVQEAERERWHGKNTTSAATQEVQPLSETAGTHPSKHGVGLDWSWQHNQTGFNT